MSVWPADLTLSDVELEALELSIQVAGTALACVLPVAILLGYVLARHDFPGKAVLNGLVHLPLILPPVVTGYILLLVMGRRGVIGSVLDEYLGIVLAFKWTGAAFAAGLMALPLILRPVRLSIEAIDRKMDQAAATLGASPFWIFLTVTLPLTIPGILAGGILGFAKAVGEFGATITFVSNIPGETRTLPLAIYSFTQIPGGEYAAMRLTLIAILLSLSALLLSEWLGRSMKRWLEV